MDTRTGNIYELADGESLIDAKERLGVVGTLVEVKRDLKEKERRDHQIKMYSPCGCGSGLKFKFCCHRTG